MVKIIVISAASLLLSCGICKEKRMSRKAEKAKTTQNVGAETNVVSEQGRPMREEDMIDIEGIVRIDKDGCPLLIEMVEGDLYANVYPENLADEFKKDGLKISFSYIPSKSVPMKGCTVEKVISITEVKLK